MATSKQSAPDLQSIGPVIEQALKGKYDGRGKYARKPSMLKPGPKPRWIKSLSRTKSHEVLQAIDSIASPEQIYTRALEKNDLSLAWSIRCDVENRLLGRPFVALNPAEVKQSPALQQDNRLQLAIGQLNIGAPANKRPIRKQLASESLESRQEPQVIDSTLVADAGK